MEDINAALLAEIGTGRIVTPGSGVGDASLVELHGDIDFDFVEPLRDAVVSRVEKGADVLVDLADLTLIDCASLGVLVQADRMAGERGHRVCLVAPRAHILRTMTGAGLEDAFPMFRDRDEAIRGLSSQPRRNA